MRCYHLYYKMTAKQIMVLGFQGNRDLTLLPSKKFLTNRAFDVTA